MNTNNDSNNNDFLNVAKNITISAYDKTACINII